MSELPLDIAIREVQTMIQKRNNRNKLLKYESHDVHFVSDTEAIKILAERKVLAKTEVGR